MSKKITIEETGNVKVFIDELDGVQYLNFETHDAGYSVSLSQLHRYLHMAEEVRQYQASHEGPFEFKAPGRRYKRLNFLREMCPDATSVDECEGFYSVQISGSLVQRLYKSQDVDKMISAEKEMKMYGMNPQEDAVGFRVLDSLYEYSKVLYS